MTTYRRLLGYFRPYAGRAFGALLLMVLVSLATGATVYLFGSLFDDVLIPSAGVAEKVSPAPATNLDRAPAAIRQRGGKLVHAIDARYAAVKKVLARRGIPLRVAIPVLLLLAFLGKNIFSYFSEYEFNRVGLAMVRDLRDDGYDCLIRQSPRFFESATTGDLMSRLLGDVELIQDAFGTQIADLFQGVLTMGVLLVYVISLNARLSFFTFVVAPLVLWPVFEISRRLRTQTSTSRARMGIIGDILQETLRGYRVVKTYGMEPFETRRFHQANQRYFRVNLRVNRIKAVSSPLIEIIASVGLVILVAYAAGRIAAGQMRVGDLIQFLTAVMMMYAPVKNITKVNIRIQQAMAAADRIFMLIDASRDVVEKPNALVLPWLRESIACEDVSFSYDRRNVLDGVSVVVRRGETVAIVGPSGAGKTTLMNLLPRLYDPTAGRITIDGIDIREATLASLRGQMALVTQETVLFNSSVRENIAYGIDHPPEDRVRSAAAAAYADDFIRELPEGYDTDLGENGGRLSGGQRQRIAIARAIFRDAPILILDEATSQLDTESEALVARALANLMEGRTTFVVAHRLSTVRRADRILVMDEGRILDSGTHAELLARDGVYRRLHEMQYFEGKGEAAERATGFGMRNAE